ncbi:MAG: class I SAM-dependent methyltransferase [Candidatus Riflebacteria bacterium]|nr:class I SAM-dependent methyltransferase [Candidatus Riflebacteria bacterium]
MVSWASMNSLERYDDALFAWQYDVSEGTGSNHGDLEFYVEALRGTPGRVLELGCGTGRISLPVARAGVALTGLDHARAVIDRARKKAVTAGLELEFVVGDAVETRLERHFEAVFMAYNSISLIENPRVPNLAANIARHLVPGGRFLFDVTRATASLYHGKDVRLVPWSAQIENERLSLRLRRRMELRHRPELDAVDCVYEWELTDATGCVETRTTSMRFSTWEPERYVGHFEAAGFSLVRLGRRPFEKDGQLREHAFVELRGGHAVASWPSECVKTRLPR